jgi:hypothetical protein
MLGDHAMLDAVRAGQVIAEVKLKNIGPIKKMPTWHQITEVSQSIQYSKC